VLVPCQRSNFSEKFRMCRNAPSGVPIHEASTNRRQQSCGDVEAATQNERYRCAECKHRKRHQYSETGGSDQRHECLCMISF
jgi:hypothetical protein